MLLLDDNFLIALGDADHVHHDEAQSFFTLKKQDCSTTSMSKRSKLLNKFHSASISSENASIGKNRRLTIPKNNFAVHDFASKCC